MAQMYLAENGFNLDQKGDFIVNKSRWKYVNPEDEEYGFTERELKRILHGNIAYVDISDEYIMLVNREMQELKIHCNIYASQMAYNLESDQNVAIYGDVLYLECSEISDELKVKE